MIGEQVLRGLLAGTRLNRVRALRATGRRLVTLRNGSRSVAEGHFRSPTYAIPRLDLLADVLRGEHDIADGDLGTPGA